MPRNVNKWVRKDRRRATRNAVRSRKAAWWMGALALFVAVAGTPGQSNADECAAPSVVGKLDARLSNGDLAGVESPWYTLTVWNGAHTAEIVAAYVLEDMECFAAMGAIVNAGGDAAWRSHQRAGIGGASQSASVRRDGRIRPR